MAGNPWERTVSVLSIWGYDDVEHGRPELCSGTPCLPENAEYVQYWNREQDGMFMTVMEDKGTKGFLAISPMKMGVIQLSRAVLTLFYVGKEQNLKDLRAMHSRMRCPLNSSCCENKVGIYDVDDPAEVFLGSISDEDYSMYEKIIKKGIRTVARKKSDFCKSRCNYDPDL